jgi:enoyl-CoA hydratase/carnithine racemase
MEMALSGDVIDARTALDWGLVNRVVPAAQLDSAVQDLLERVTRGSAESKGIGKQAFYAQVDLDQPKAYAYAIEVMAATSQLPDAREGMRAFLDKRKPVWGARDGSGNSHHIRTSSFDGTGADRGRPG